MILGDDFRFLTADEWNLQVSNYDKLMNYINNEKSFNMNVSLSIFRLNIKLFR